MLYIGIDVAKKTLQVFDGQNHRNINNSQRDILKLLKEIPKDSLLALEATGGYGMLLAELAVEKGYTVYMLRPQQIIAFRGTLDDRAKTDKKDAELIAKFIEVHHPRLRPFLPLDEPYKTLRKLARVRSALRSKAASIRLCLKDLGEDAREIIKAIDGKIAKLDTRIQTILEQIPEAAILQTIPSIKQATVSVLIPALMTKNFKTRDAFIAYIGLDLKVCESGTKKGRRKLSHRGDPGMRKALYMAAMSASHSKTWKHHYQAFRAKLPGIAALNALARKLAKVIFGIYKSKTPFCKQTLT